MTAQSIRDRYRIGGSMKPEAQSSPIAKSATLMDDGSLQILSRSGKNEWSLTSHATGSMIAERFREAFEYAEEV